MATVTQSPPTSAEQRFLLRGMSWDFYTRLLEELDDRPIRVTFDRGALELMSPSYRHERYGRLLGDLIGIIAEELGQRFLPGGSTTFRKEALNRGLEPDDCFYLQSIDAILGKEELDLMIDPPPDLAVEIDMTRSSLDRMGIYAALGVPEIWRFDGSKLEAMILQRGGRYSAGASLAFPTVPLDGIVQFLDRAFDTDRASVRQAFREWLRSVVLPTE